MIDDHELLSLLREELSDAEAYTDVLVGTERAKALDYYLRRPMGDEREGRSSAISAEVYKVVEGVSTAIANIYAGAKNPIEFVPRSADDVEKAEQRTAAVEYIFHVQNNGFLAMLESIKDGVLSKTGFLTWRWELERRVTQETYRDQTPESIALLTQDNAAVQIVQATPKQAIGPDGQPTMLVDAVVNIIEGKGRCVVEAVPPEEIKVSSRARSIDIQRAPCVMWCSTKTRTELLKAGYPPDVVDRLNFNSRGHDESPVLRLRDESSEGQNGEARIYTTWIEHDCDQDGIAELRRILWTDEGILENQITDEINLSAWSPNIQPHEFFGRCPADDAVDSQEIMSSIKRQVLDNLYLANNPMWRVDASDSRVNIEDFYSPEIGRPMRAPKDGAEAVVFPFVAQHSFPLLEYEQADQENRTGFTRYAQGLDGKSLNQTARGISIINTMSQQRVQLMARIYGEMCLKPALRGIAKMLSQYGDRQLTFRLNGKYTTVDPREWKEEFDMSVNVGLGTTDRDQQLVHLMSMAQAQAQAVQAGLVGQLVTPKNLYNVQAKIAENAGFKDASFAWTDPDTVAPPQQGPSPEEIAQQADMQREQMRLEVDVLKHREKLAADRETKLLEIAAQEQLTARKAQLDTEANFGLADLTHRQTIDLKDREQAKLQEDEMNRAEVEQHFAALHQALAQTAQAMQQLAEGQAAIITGIQRLGTARRSVIRGADGRIAGIDLIDQEPQATIQ